MGVDVLNDINLNLTAKKRAPTSKPPFTLGEVKRAIPPHCFQRSLVRSLSYIIYDLAAFFAPSYLAANYIPLLPQPLRYLVWPLHWFTAGTLMAAFWVIAHECGHHAFSNYRWLNDAVGFMIHSTLMVPYFSWKYTHARHHSNTGSADHDEVLCPKRKNALSRFDELINNPPGRIFKITVSTALGWPLYLTLNVSGRNYEKFASHFYPLSPMYPRDSHRLRVFLSDIGVVAVAYGLYRLALVKGFTWILFMYFMPFMVFNGWLVTVAFLNHTHSALPRYDTAEWDWLRGALSTVDRDYGIFNHILHHITDTHVMHHLIPHVPHYHAMEATKAIKPILGEYFQYDDTPILKALYRETKECIFLEPQREEKGILWFSDKIKS